MAMKVFFPSHARLRRLRYLFSLEKNQLIMMAIDFFPPTTEEPFQTKKQNSTRKNSIGRF